MNHNTLFQRSFSKNTAPIVKKNRYKSAKLINVINCSSKVSTGFSIEIIVIILLLIFYLLFNYSIIRTLGFVANDWVEYIGMFLMIVCGAASGTLVYRYKVIKNNSFIAQLISLFYSFVGDLIGIAVVFFIWLFIYVFISIIS